VPTKATIEAAKLDQLRVLSAALLKRGERLEDEVGIKHPFVPETNVAMGIALAAAFLKGEISDPIASLPSLRELDANRGIAFQGDLAAFMERGSD
jgi:hypothetical protein